MSDLYIDDSVPPQQPRKAAWHDPQDDILNVSLQASTSKTRTRTQAQAQNHHTSKSLRKLREFKDEDVISVQELESRLRKKFVELQPLPTWADRSQRTKKRKHSDDSSDFEQSDFEEVEERSNDQEAIEAIEALLKKSTIGKVTQNDHKSRRKAFLKKGEIELERRKDANISGKTGYAVQAVEFHPTAPLLLTGTFDRRLRLFNIDGNTNPLLTSIHIPSLPLSTASFTPQGNSILLTSSRRPFFYIYDLTTGQTTRSARFLYSSTGSIGKNTHSQRAGDEERDLSIARFSNSGTGTGHGSSSSSSKGLLAIGGRSGRVHLLDSSIGNFSSWDCFCSFKINSWVKDLVWDPVDQNLVNVLGSDSVVSVWDIRMVGRSKSGGGGSGTVGVGVDCVSSWRDVGGFGPTVLAKGGTSVVVGSTTGVVSMYNSSKVKEDSTPTPIRTFDNLRTSITTLKYNPDSQLLAMASNKSQNAFRLVHTPSRTVFANWPKNNTPLGIVNCVDFSNKGEYMVIGNHKGNVLLYAMKHYLRI